MANQLTQEPQKSVSNAKTKLRWVSNLCNNLEIKIENYIDSQTFRINTNYDNDKKGIIFNFSLEEPLPYDVPCLIGDIFGNLRASLDYCWMGLLRARMSRPPKATLPVAPTKRELEKKISKSKKMIDPNIFDCVKNMIINEFRIHGDFQNGGNQDFWLLNDLNNTQKHNMIVPTLGVTKLPSDCRIDSNDGSSIICGGSIVSGNAYAIGGNFATISHSEDWGVEFFLPRDKGQKTVQLLDVVDKSRVLCEKMINRFEDCVL